MVDIDFVFIGDLIMDKIVLNLKSFADRWCNIHILALISEVVRCSSMEELSSTLLLLHDRVHVYASWLVRSIQVKSFALVHQKWVDLLLHFVHHFLISIYLL